MMDHPPAQSTWPTRQAAFLKKMLVVTASAIWLVYSMWDGGIAGLGLGGEGWTTMTITTPTGEGVTSARTFVRLRRCVLVDAFRIV